MVYFVERLSLVEKHFIFILVPKSPPKGKVIFSLEFGSFVSGKKLGKMFLDNRNCFCILIEFAALP